MKFPHQLHALLCEAERLGLSDIIAWEPSGESFIIRKPHEFAEKIMPRLFRQTKLSSFKRQLNAYGFERQLSNSLDLLVYSNLPLFRRTSPETCNQICRRRSSHSADKLRLQKANNIKPGHQTVQESFNELRTSRSVLLLHDSVDAMSGPAFTNNTTRAPFHSDPVLDEMAELLDCSEEDYSILLEKWDPIFEGLL
jgi:HSF-type DNA-binding